MQVSGLTRLLPHGDIIISGAGVILDVGYAIVKFKDDVSGVYMRDWVGHGEPVGFEGGTMWIQGTKGSIVASSPRICRRGRLLKRKNAGLSGKGKSSLSRLTLQCSIALLNKF